MFRTLALRNVAPSDEHPSHDVYVVEIADADCPHPLRLSRSIGGGHAERGGSVELALDALDAWPGDWRQHLRHAGADWAIAVLERAPTTSPATILATLRAGR